MEIYISDSPMQTEQIASDFAKKLCAGEVIAFRGGLGMGKTCFTRGLASGLGFNGEVTSPTFALINEYIGGRLNVYHFDMYRISSWDELYSCGYFEYTEEVSVRPHWIDSLGHVNNFKYGQLTFDNLPEEFAERTKDITRMEMFFTGELRLNESVKISRKVENNLVEVAGTHATDGESAFLYRIFFGE